MTASSRLLVYLLAHVLGDFYLQSEKLAVGKIHNWGNFFAHCTLYAIPFLLSFGLLQQDLWIIAALILGHAMMDLLKKLILNEKFQKNSFQGRHQSDAWLFVLDQVVHLAFIVGVSAFFGNVKWQPWVNPVWLDYIRWILMILLVLLPASVSFEHCFKKYRPQDLPLLTEGTLVTASKGPGEEATKQGAGQVIGMLERLFTVFALSQSQFSAIAVILAAKSLARFEKINKNPGFAEYYLIGTLYSILFALLSYLLVFKLLV